MWKFYLGGFILLLIVLVGSAALQLKGSKPVTRPAIYQPAAPSQDDSAMSNMRIP